MRLLRRAGIEPCLRPFLSGGTGAPPFRDAFVAVAPPRPGVYFLYRKRSPIYIGVAVQGAGIRQELEKHLNGIHGLRTRSATAFDFEETRHAIVARREYLVAYMAQHGGRLPCCNESEV